MANPFSPPAQPATFNLNPPPDDGSQTVSNTISWNGNSGTAGILQKIGAPLQTWIINLISSLTSAFSAVLTGPNSATAGNIAIFGDTTGKLVADSGISTVGLLPSGALTAYAGPTAPAGWLLCFGQAVSRTGANANLFATISIAIIGNTHTSTTIDGIASTANIQVGYPISGSGIQAGTTVASVSGTSITISLPTTSSANGVAIVVAPYGVGDGSTTFNVPDLRGRFLAGADAMGGTAANRLGSNSSVGGISGTASLGAAGGAQTHVQTLAELVPHNHGYLHWQNNSNIGAGGNPPGVIEETLNTGSTGGGAGFNITPPVLVINMII